MACARVSGLQPRGPHLFRSLVTSDHGRRHHQLDASGGGDREHWCSDSRCRSRRREIGGAGIASDAVGELPGRSGPAAPTYVVDPWRGPFSGSDLGRSVAVGRRRPQSRGRDDPHPLPKVSGRRSFSRPGEVSDPGPPNSRGRRPVARIAPGASRALRGLEAASRARCRWAGGGPIDHPVCRWLGRHAVQFSRDDRCLSTRVTGSAGRCRWRFCAGQSNVLLGADRPGRDDQQ